MRRRGLSLLLLGLTAMVSCTAIPPMADSTPAIAAELPITTAAPPAEEEPDPGYQSATFWLAQNPVQGGIVVARAPSGARKVIFNGNEVPVTKDGFFLIGFDRDAENSASLVAEMRKGSPITDYLKVTPGNWRIENVNANPTGGAATTEEFNARRGPELARINAARAQNNESDGWRQQFIWPVRGRLSGLFGAQRIYRGSPGTYHSGMDIAVPSGTPFVAPADGVVVLAATDAPFTLEGHLLMIDHGMGLNSAFLHCSQLLVKEGDHVKQGQIIGKVGMTGRASGPHLHWGMKWNASRTDPKLLVPAS